MKKHLLPLLLLTIMMMALSACRTTTPKVDYTAIAKASVRLGIDIDLNDNHTLYVEAAEWMGVPYRSGGNSKSGIDCSGFAYHIYNKVYHIKLPRTSTEQHAQSRKINKSALKEGDMVFFTSERSGKQVAHSGIYLKNGKFIHASTSNGIIISNLDEPYYRKHWKSGGKFK